MNCQYQELSNKENTCENEPFANITLEGDNGNITIDICEVHLNVLASQFPVEESENAQSSR